MSASKEVLNSKRLPQVLEVILEIGNFLNEGSARAGGFGFKLTTLNKLDDTRASDNKTSLLQYVVRFLEKNAPQLLKFYEDIPSVEAASRISLQSVSSDVNSVQKDYDITSKFVEKVKLTEKLPALTSFTIKVKGSLESIQENYASLDETYKKAVTYLGEDSKLQPEEFFGILAQFVRSIQEAIKKNELAAQMAEKQKRREEIRQHKLKTLSRTLVKEVKKEL